MSATLNGAIAVTSIVATEQVTDGLATGPESASHVAAGQSYSNGTANGQAQHVVSQTLNVNTTGTTLDLTAMAGGTDGATRNFSSIEEILIENIDTTNAVNAGPGAANGWTGIVGAATGSIQLEPTTAGNGGGHYKRSSPSTGLAVAAGNKTILLAAAAATANAKITVVGRGS